MLRVDHDSIRSLPALYLFAGAAAFEWSIHLPTLPLLIAKDLGETANMIGLVLSTFSTCSLLSFFFEPQIRMLLPSVSTRNWLQLALLLRATSGVLHVVGSRHAIASDPHHSDALTYLFAARALHGLSSGSYAISLAWVGAALDDVKRPEAIAFINGATVFGTLTGPLAGASIAGAVGNDRFAAELAGWVVMLLSAMQLVVSHSHFPSAIVPPAKAPPEILPSSWSRPRSSITALTGAISTWRCRRKISPMQ